MIYNAKDFKRYINMGLIIVFFLACLVVLGKNFILNEREEAKVNRGTAMQVTKAVQEIPQGTVDFFTEYRMEREKIRSERADLLREILKTATNDEAKNKAQDNVLKITLEKQKESEMENLIKAKGFTDALVFIKDNSVNAVIKASSLTKEDVLQVAEVISHISGVKSENITIGYKP